MKAATETEVKIRLPNRAAILDRINQAGFTPSVARLFESNTLYDTADQALRRSGIILRLRQAGENCVITWKGLGEVSSYKSRRELETAIGSLQTMHQILEHLGYAPSFRYEKYRTEFVHAQNGAGVVTLDETPIGDFLELEGPGEWIDNTAKQLGFSPRDYILDSYARLYVVDCERRGLEPGDMVFASHP
jgi:adenylate cyclase, class 2